MPGIFDQAIAQSQGIPIAAQQSIFAQPQQRTGVGGFFDRLNQGVSSPLFGLGAGLLSGSPQAGFQNAQTALRTQQAGQAFGQGQDPQAVREARFLFPGDLKKQRAFVEKRTTGQAGGVQSTIIDENGFINLVMRGGQLVNTGQKAQNLAQFSDIGGVLNRLDRRSGDATPVTTPEQVGGNAAAIASIKKFGELADTAAADLPKLEAETSVLTEGIKRLQPGGDLRKGFERAYGFKRPNQTLLAGDERRDAQAQIAQIVKSQTLEAIKAFKGSISDKDIELAEAAATRLSDTTISENEADRALNELANVFARNEAIVRKRAAQSPAGAPAPSQTDDLTKLTNEELDALIRELGGQ